MLGDLKGDLIGDYVVRESWTESEYGFRSPSYIPPIAQAAIDTNAQWSADDVSFGYETGPIEPLPFELELTAIDEMSICNEPCKLFDDLSNHSQTSERSANNDVGQDEQPKTPASQIEDIGYFNSLLLDDDEDSLVTIEDDCSHDSPII